MRHPICELRICPLVSPIAHGIAAPGRVRLSGVRLNGFETARELGVIIAYSTPLFHAVIQVWRAPIRSGTSQDTPPDYGYLTKYVSGPLRLIFAPFRIRNSSDSSAGLVTTMNGAARRSVSASASRYCG